MDDRFLLLLVTERKEGCDLEKGVMNAREQGDADNKIVRVDDVIFIMIVSSNIIERSSIGMYSVVADDDF